MITQKITNKQVWITICLLNLSIVALLGLGLRSKILFSIPFIDYRSLLSAHSHFAFAGWAGLSIITLLIHDLLPQDLSQKKIYAFLLTGIQISSLGMAITFPFYGYNAVTIFFSTLYIVVTFIFAFIYTKDLISVICPRNIKLLALGAVSCLLISYLGTLGLVYIISAKSVDAILYRDSIYTFLHFQYNGFFTLGLFALYYNHQYKKGLLVTIHDKRFITFLTASIIPSLFLALLWHNSNLFYGLAAVGSILLIGSIVYFVKTFRKGDARQLFNSPFANTLVLFAGLSFILKMMLNAGTIVPALGDAVYGDRPIIIGFLHLVFLGMLTFYLLAMFWDQGVFSMSNRLLKFPIIVFSAGIFLNEILLFVQGLIILFNVNSPIFQWLLWAAAIILFAGSLMIFLARLKVRAQKKDT